jgi:transposase
MLCLDAGGVSLGGGGAVTTDPMLPFFLTLAQMRWLSPSFPLSHGIPRVDDRRVRSGIINLIRHGLRRRDAPPGHGPHKTL